MKRSGCVFSAEDVLKLFEDVALKLILLCFLYQMVLVHFKEKALKVMGIAKY